METLKQENLKNLTKKKWHKIEVSHRIDPDDDGPITYVRVDGKIRIIEKEAGKDPFSVLQEVKNMKVEVSLCEMVDEQVFTKHKVFRFPTPLEIKKMEVEIPDNKLAELTDFFYDANGKLRTSGYQIGISIIQK